jgi:hypothetical protein
MDRYSAYYQAVLKKEEALFAVGTLKYFDHLCFDRTIDKDKLLYEFFVPPALEAEFLKIMEFLIQKGLILNLEKLPNRIQAGGTF